MSDLNLIVPLFDAKRQFYALSKLLLIRRYASDKLTEDSPFCGRAMKPSPLMAERRRRPRKNRFVEFDRLDSLLRGGHKLGL